MQIRWNMKELDDKKTELSKVAELLSAKTELTEMLRQDLWQLAIQTMKLGGINSNQVAKETGLTRVYIGYAINGKRPLPTTETLLKIANAINKLA